MTDKKEPIDLERQSDPRSESSDNKDLETRRAFLLGLGKWSRAVIVGAIAGGALLTDRPAQAGWINRRGGGWGGGS
jgi:hypothetical protein